MKFLITTAIVLVIVFLGFRLVYTKTNAGKQEREWYAKQLGYNFSATIDTVIMLRGNVGLGKIVCRQVSGKLNPALEDSLNQSLQHFKSLRLVLNVSGDKLEFIFMGAECYSSGDSLTVNSSTNELRFFRGGNILSVNELSNVLEARGSPLTF
jgi:hypothetical protein